LKGEELNRFIKRSVDLIGVDTPSENGGNGQSAQKKSGNGQEKKQETASAEGGQEEQSQSGNASQ
jgi:hypothetical protein